MSLDRLHPGLDADGVGARPARSPHCILCAVTGTPAGIGCCAGAARGTRPAPPVVRWSPKACQGFMARLGAVGSVEGSDPIGQGRTNGACGAEISFRKMRSSRRMNRSFCAKAKFSRLCGSSRRRAL